MGRRNRKDDDGNVYLFKERSPKRKKRKKLPKKIACMSWAQKMGTVGCFDELIERGNDHAYAAQVLMVPLEMIEKWKADRVMVERLLEMSRRRRAANAV